MNFTKTQFLKTLILWAACFLGIGQFLFGCAPTRHEVLLKMYEIEAAKQEKTAIINGYFGRTEKEKEEKRISEENFFSERSEVITRAKMVKRRTGERLPLPEPQGSGIDVPCSVKCLDNCDEQCRIECPELWGEMCGDDELSDIIMEQRAEAAERAERAELTELEDVGDEPVKEEQYAEEEKSINVFASASGDNNTQTNVIGDGNRVIVQGGSGPNSNGPSPIEQAMADLLRGKVTPLKSSGEIAGEQARGLISDTADAVVKVAPAVLTGVAIKAASNAVLGISREAGDRYENMNNSDSSDHSDNSDHSYNSDSSTTTTTTTEIAR